MYVRLRLIFQKLTETDTGIIVSVPLCVLSQIVYASKIKLLRYINHNIFRRRK